MGLVSGLALYLVFCAGALLVQADPPVAAIQQVSDLTRTSAPGRWPPW